MTGELDVCLPCLESVLACGLTPQGSCSACLPARGAHPRSGADGRVWQGGPAQLLPLLLPSGPCQASCLVITRWLPPLQGNSVGGGHPQEEATPRRHELHHFPE